MSFNRLKYDNCAYSKEIEESTSPLDYYLFKGKYENCKQCPVGSHTNNLEFDFVTIGWGDKGFFLDTPTWAELKVSTALNAAFLPSTTAMHVKYSGEPKVSETRKKVYLNRKAYLKMVKYIKKSFHTKNNEVELIGGKGYSNDDNFYEANKSYHMFRTCNRWTNRALKEANIKTGVFALFPNGIISHL